MGLFNKLKNVLFEEEEITVPEVSEKPESKEKISNKKNSVKMTFQDEEEEEIVSDRELFKAEPTFNFPMFDEKEFEKEKKEDVVSPYKKAEEEFKRVKSPSVFDIERGRTPKNTEYSHVSYKPEKKVERTVTPIEQRKFHPSPVISPVYGILDKNYKKEDIKVRTPEKKMIDVDSVRKKAFGTLEDDIEKTLTSPVRKFYEERPKEEKALDELLKSSIDDEIMIPSLKNDDKYDYESFNIKENSQVEEDTDYLEILDKKRNKPQQDVVTDETLENDLFDLIDSMYDNREGGE